MNDFIGAIKSPSKERGRKSKRRTSLFVLYFQTVGKRKNEYRKIPLRYSLLTPGFTDGRMAHFRLKCCACNGNGDISPCYLRLFNHRKHGFALAAKHRLAVIAFVRRTDCHSQLVARVCPLRNRRDDDIRKIFLPFGRQSPAQALIFHKGIPAPFVFAVSPLFTTDSLNRNF